MASDETYLTPISSTGDLMAMSPQRKEIDQSDITSDFLTGTEFDSICDVTMQEIQKYDDMFIDPNSLDYLVKCADSNKNSNIVDRGKDSLFIKFDPLYAKSLLRNSIEEKTRGDLECDVGYETGSSSSVLTENVPEMLKANVIDAVNSKCSIDKPIQVVSPVVSTELPKVTKSQTAPAPVLVRSISAILTPTQVGLESLVNISGNTPPRAAPRSPHHAYYGSGLEVDRLQSLRNILQKQERENLLLLQENMELKSYKRTNEEFEKKYETLRGEKDAWLHRECKLMEQINNKILSNKQMAIVMEEYEKNMLCLIDDRQKEKSHYEQMLNELIAERDESVKHLNNMESSFNDLLTKYEKCKTVINDYKEREKTLNQKILEYEEGMKKYDVVYNKLKEVTSESLNKANETLDNIKKAHSIEIAKLNATIKKNEITILSLQESLSQKTRDIEELTRICDQLIDDVR